jgi:mRNA-degrading endonuclease RelE of RelBE toxin-antitoxin system
MSFRIEAIPRFEKDVKKLKKRFPRIKNDLVQFIDELELNHKLGVDLGENIFKARIPNSSLPAGKSGGFRVITYYKTNDVLYLVTIYSKTDKDTILTERLKQIIKYEIDSL